MNSTGRLTGTMRISTWRCSPDPTSTETSLFSYAMNSVTSPATTATEAMNSTGRLTGTMRISTWRCSPDPTSTETSLFSYAMNSGTSPATTATVYRPGATEPKSTRPLSSLVCQTVSLPLTSASIVEFTAPMSTSESTAFGAALA